MKNESAATPELPVFCIPKPFVTELRLSSELSLSLSFFFLFKICQCPKRGQGELTLNGKKANVVESKRLSEAVEIALPKYSLPMVNNDKLQR